MNKTSIGYELSTINFFAVNGTDCEQIKILVVDDHPFSRMKAVDLLLLDGYEVFEADSSLDIVNYAIKTKPDLILLDIAMSQIDGFEVCRSLKEDTRTCLIPVILIGVSEDRQSRLKCIEVGGDELLIKPLDRLVLSARVKSLIEQKRLNEDLDRTEQVLFAIAKAIESRYCDSGRSCARLTALAQSFGEYLKLPLSEIKNLIYAAYLHDIGIVAIPDAVLLKKGELSLRERETVEQHVLIGEKICQPLKNRREVLPIIRHHHERWDGSGYPDGLSGDKIPYLAQVFQVLDIYEAITSERPYKQAYTPAQALEIIAQETDKGWRNPELVREFINFIEEIEMKK